MKRRSFLGALLGAVVAPTIVAKEVVQPTPVPASDLYSSKTAEQIIANIRETALQLYEQSGYQNGNVQPDRILMECGNESWSGCMFTGEDYQPKPHPDSIRRQRRATARLKRQAQQGVPPHPKDEWYLDEDGKVAFNWDQWEKNNPTPEEVKIYPVEDQAGTLSSGDYQLTYRTGRGLTKTIVHVDEGVFQAVSDPRLMDVSHRAREQRLDTIRYVQLYTVPLTPAKSLS